VIAALLAGVVLTGLFVQRLTTPTLRLIEGYWPAWLGWAWRRLVDRYARRLEAIKQRQQQLADRLDTGQASRDDRDEYVRLDLALRQMPVAHQLMPTRIGNLLQAAEARPTGKYGLDTVTVWSRLWLAFPDNVRTELVAARGALESSVSLCLYGLFGMALLPWSWWGLIGPVVTGTVLALWMPPRAAVYGELVEAAVDCHRTTLYRQLRWPLPVNPAHEIVQGRRLTTYLLRGTDGDEPTFVPEGNDGG
jgi:hypothetical protein